MKFQTIFFFGAILALAFVARAEETEVDDIAVETPVDAAPAEEVATDALEEEEKKKEYVDSILVETAKNVATDCFNQMKTHLAEAATLTFEKYATKVKKGEPFYKKEGKKFSIGRALKHSMMKKEAVKVSKQCIKDAKKAFGKVVKEKLQSFFDGLKKLWKNVIG